MKPSHSYVLVLDQQADDLQLLESLLTLLKCSMVAADSVEQAMTRVSQEPPCLVILAGSCHYWSQTLVNRLRHQADTASVTIVALTDVHAPNWQHRDDELGLDGFLVKPLSFDVLTSLVQSAWVRQAYCSA